MIWEYGAKSILRLSPDEDARFRRSYYSETTPNYSATTAKRR